MLILSSSGPDPGQVRVSWGSGRSVSGFSVKSEIIVCLMKIHQDLLRVNSVVPDVEVGEAPGVVHQVDGGKHQGELHGVSATSQKHIAGHFGNQFFCCFTISLKLYRYYHYTVTVVHMLKLLFSLKTTAFRFVKTLSYTWKCICWELRNKKRVCTTKTV